MKQKLINKGKKIFPSKSFVGLLLSIFILVSPVLNNNFIMGHDCYFHITNMLSTYEHINIANFNFMLPKLFGGPVANGFGYGTGIFYPPLSYYLTAYIANVFNFTKTNNLFTLTLTSILIILLSGITMYIFLKKVFKDNRIAGVGSISYVSSTYFLCNIYVRTALAESLTFIFIPLVFLGLYELFLGDEKKFYLPFIIGYIGMFYSHLIMSVYLTIIIMIVFLIHFKKVFKIDKIIKLLFATTIILLITSPYLVSLLEHKIFGNYVVFKSGSMYHIEQILENTIKIKDYFKIKPLTKHGIKVFVNPVVLIISTTTIIFSQKIFKDKKTIYRVIIIMLITTIFIASKYFPWSKMPPLLNNIQFPWRLRTFIAFLLAILSGNIVKIIKHKYSNIIIILLSLLITFAGYKTITDKYRIINVEEFFNSNKIFNNMGVQKEYLPVNTKRNIKYFNNRNKEIIVKQGNADIYVLYSNTPDLKFTINSLKEEVILELPRLYYLGYRIEFTNNQGNTKKIKYYENEYGFIEIVLKEVGTITVSYTGTNANKICNYISIITIFTYLLIIGYRKYRKHHIDQKLKAYKN